MVTRLQCVSSADGVDRGEDGVGDAVEAGGELGDAAGARGLGRRHLEVGTRGTRLQVRNFMHKGHATGCLCGRGKAYVAIKVGSSGYQ